MTVTRLASGDRYNDYDQIIRALPEIRHQIPNIHYLLIVYLEALACGKPTIGGNQDGEIDALCHGELGVLINPDNIDENRYDDCEALARSVSMIYSLSVRDSKAKID